MASIQLIMTMCEAFTQQQNQLVLKLINGLDLKISRCSDGCRINLDKISPAHIDMLYIRVLEIKKPIEIVYQI
jgi:hypothetical protein